MKRIVIIFLLGIIVIPAIALELGKIVLPDEMGVGDTTRVLNGAGWRKKLVIKVYAGALYLTEKSSDAAAILSADEAMAVKMHFVYKKVEAEKLINAWNEGFVNAGVEETLKSEIDTFNSYFNKPAMKGDIYDIIYLPGTGTSLYINDEYVGTVPGFEFKQAVFAIWLGENTALPGLKEKLLNL